MQWATLHLTGDWNILKKSVESETEQIDLWGEMTTAMGHYVRGFSLFLGVKEVKGEAKSSFEQLW